MKKIICLLLLFCSYYVASSEDYKYFNCIIFIDGELARPSSLSNEYILIKRPDDSVCDTAKVDYNYGTILFPNESFRKITNASLSDSSTLAFDYLDLRPKQQRYHYKIKLDPSWLYQSYLIIRIYNYDKAINRKKFGQTNGYGIEIANSLYRTVLPHL